MGRVLLLCVVTDDLRGAKGKHTVRVLFVAVVVFGYICLILPSDYLNY